MIYSRWWICSTCELTNYFYNIRTLSQYWESLLPILCIGASCCRYSEFRKGFLLQYLARSWKVLRSAAVVTLSDRVNGEHSQQDKQRSEMSSLHRVQLWLWLNLTESIKKIWAGSAYAPHPAVIRPVRWRQYVVWLWMMSGAEKHQLTGGWLLPQLADSQWGSSLRFTFPDKTSLFSR